ncbi:MAG: ABC transporter ATP-binding protein [Betaproteobacteria bacterium]|jgi:branched-chain amino acid transport system ATP-binding protein
MNWALEVKGLKKSFGGVAVTQDIFLQVAAGERRLIIGPNGAGKTTLFAQITGDLKPDAGSVALFGDDVTKLPVHKRIHTGMSRTYQIITLFSKDTLAHNVVLSLLGINSRKKSMFSELLHKDAIYQHAIDLLESVGLKDKAHSKVTEISYGEQRRVEIALALAQKPKLLLLDEPLAGLSLDERVMVSELINGISRDTAIVMIEHDMEMALAFAEKIMVLQYGKCIVDGDRDAVVNDPKTQEVYLGH